MLAFIGILFLAKAAIVRSQLRRRSEVFVFSCLVILAIPVTWAIDHDWNQINLEPIMHWIGIPVGALAVPIESFALDRKSREQRGRLRSAWWYVLEFVVVVPVWIYVWTLFSFFGLGWGWI
jgi:hypothetical protein